MEETDAFLTRTIVGAPFSALLGRRASAQEAASAGLNVDRISGRARLAQAWDDHLLLGHAHSPAGRARRRPGPVRRALERHALVLALAGLAALAAGALLATRGVGPWR